jgi:hypothetical protein
MNARLVTAVIGLVMVVLGALALFYPKLVMDHVLGYAVHQAHSANFVYGEVRAAYGGMFVVAGAATVLAAMDIAANSGRILFVGMLWLGACAGRLFGVFVDGGPGVFGWLSITVEALAGGALVAISQSAPQRRSHEPAAVAAPLPPSAPPAQAPPLA